MCVVQAVQCVREGNVARKVLQTTWCGAVACVCVWCNSVVWCASGVGGGSTGRYGIQLLAGEGGR